ncbi:MAG: protein GlmU [Deltaproteobacteria bacterium]|jgi:bifunctional UDP-N-acetylglucosamine pyrophosphorylase/glucosamine-1-phosphate N-acetyltransferase
MMTHQKETKIAQLIARGVRLSCPESIEIGEEVEVDRISGDGVIIHAGSKILGDATVILRGAVIGFEAPATVKNCQIGPGVELKGGFFEDAVFLANAKAGLGSHVREASIFEEQASIAHTVGTKHTILFPFVTLGSLINFCDCLMAGGTSRKNHSEVGSSYVHFNFTPNQDKVTASLIGDVPKGVMLNQAPIFLGGQGGLIGPCRLAYGTTVAAGTIVRKDELRPGRLLYGGNLKAGNQPYPPGRYRNEKRVIQNNIIYIANLIALGQWYRHVRSQFISEYFTEPLLVGLEEKLNRAISERINRLEALCDKIQISLEMEIKKGGKPESPSPALKQKQEWVTQWPRMQDLLNRGRTESGEASDRDAFLENVRKGIGKKGLDYISVIQGLTPSDAAIGTRWLQGIVDRVVNTALSVVPSFK